MDLKHFGKKGQTNTISKFVGIIAGVFLLAVIIVSVVQGSLTGGLNEVVDFTTNTFGPFFSFILGLEGNNAGNAFIATLTFILLSIIIIGTLDSVNIFGEDKQGGLINLAVGIIVSIIGVRFMPSGMWASLTAPSSALVALFLVGAPFLALFFITMKIKFSLANKLLWLFYVLFMSYLIFMGPSQQGFGLNRHNDFAWIYLAFLIGAILVMAFDSTVRRYIRTEKAKLAMAKGVSEAALAQRARKQKELEEWIVLKGTYKRGSQDRQEAEEIIRNLKAEIAELGKDNS
jgi:hypothetical protein